jgi:hypothetical protein
MLCPVLLQVASLLLGANIYLDEAKIQLEALRYDKAEARLRLAQQVPNSTQAQRREIFDLLARALAAQGRMDEAQQSYEELLTEDPDAPQPQGVSPKIRDVYRKAKERLYPPGFVTLKQLPSPAARVELSMVDPWRAVAEVLLSESLEGRPFTQRRVDLRGRRASAVLARPAPGQIVRWYVTARSATGSTLAQLGSEAAPLEVKESSMGPERPALPLASAPVEGAAALAPVGVEKPSGQRSKTPAYVLAGASVVAAAVGVGLALSSAADSKAAGEAPFASDTYQLDQRARAKAVWANALIGGAVVGGGVSAVLYFTW